MSPVVSQLAGLAAAPVPETVRAGIPSRIIDVVGIAVRASTLETSRAVIGFAVDQGSAAQATAIGAGQAISAAEAAFVNGVLAHSLDYDDTHLPSILHPSASVVPAALAVAEWQSVSGAALLDAVAVGLETTVRLGMGGYDPQARQSVYFERGQHATSICGAVGSAAAAGRLLGLGSDGITHAMGIACSMASGIIEANRSGGTVKRLHCGWAAPGRGHRGSTRGTGHYRTTDRNRRPVRDCSKRSWVTNPTSTRSPRTCQIAGIAMKSSTSRIQRTTSPTPESTPPWPFASEVSAPRTSLAPPWKWPPPTVRTIGDPIEAKRMPETGYHAQFSGPYTVVAGLLGGGGLGVGLDDFSDALARDPLRRELMERVDVVGDPQLMQIYPYQLPARLSVTTTSGQTLVEEVLANRGGPDRPLSASELAAKYTDNTAGLLSSQDACRTHETLSGLAGIDSTAGLLDPLQRIDAPTKERP